MASGSAASDAGDAPERRAHALFERVFGRAPARVASASGRVNLIGDHIDYAGGAVLPMAIAARTAVAIGPSASGEDAFASEWSGDARWSRYAKGVLVELRAHLRDVPAMDSPRAIAVAGDLPVGAGLSSSAALEVAVARAALAEHAVALPPREIALVCQRAEHAHAGVPCGIMDQWCVAHARPGEAILLDCASLDSRPVALPEDLEIAFVDSGVRHALRDGGYAARRADVDEAAARLGVEHLAGLPRERWPELDALPDRLARRARHVVREHARVGEAVSALERGDLARFGELLSESHASLRDDFDVSTPELDAIVAESIRTGALGARMTGGGFGGMAIVARRRSDGSAAARIR